MMSANDARAELGADVSKHGVRKNIRDSNPVDKRELMRCVIEESWTTAAWKVIPSEQTFSAVKNGKNLLPL